MTPLCVEFEDPDRKPVVCDSAENSEESLLSGTSEETSGTPRPIQHYEGVPLVAHAIDTALRAHLANVSVLVGGDVAMRTQIENAVCDAAARAGAPTPHLLSYDHAHDRAATRRAQGFELFGLTKGILDNARSCFEVCPQADSILVISCDQVRITPRHLYEVCRTFRVNNDIDAVTSWITWLRRTPLLLSRRFLDGLDESALIMPGPNGLDRPIPSLTIKEVVFGEEKLAANATTPMQVDTFFKDCTLSAREAIRTARDEQKPYPPPLEPDHQKNTTTPAAAEKASTRSEADEQLIDIARDVLGRLDASLTPDEEDDLVRVDVWAQRNRGDFPLLIDNTHRDTLAYLDAAATTQRPFRSLQAQSDFDTHRNANVYRGTYELSTQATASLNDARKRLEDFIGADRRQTVYTANTSASCALIAQAWGEHQIQAGDLIVTTIAEHHSNLLPWLMLAQRKQARLAYLPIRGDGHLDLDVYEQLLAQKPKLVCAAHISNVIGIVNPIHDMAAAAHEVGARFFLDAAQSLPHMTINVQNLGADFIAFSGHKMYGPLGIGGLWIAPEAFDEMDPLVSGGGAISHAAIDSYYLRAGAIQYEVGTPPISQAIGWAAAIDYLDALDMDAVNAHDATLTRYLVRGLHGIDDVTVWGDHDNTEGLTGLVSFSLASVAPIELGTVCGRLGVAIRSGGHCALPLAASMGMVGTGRASFSVSTTREDIEAVIIAVTACQHLYRER